MFQDRGAVFEILAYEYLVAGYRTNPCVFNGTSNSSLLWGQ
jgi:hypothetical protein